MHLMKSTFTWTFAAFALLTPALFAQKPGVAVTPEALGKLEWIQGDAPTGWEPGKLYVLECWATWCGPCVAAIPHVDALYDKYEPQGLRVIGVSVWERSGKEPVAAFVKKKADGMSYPVAYAKRGGAFDTQWLDPAGVTGIPRAFVVKDGKVLATTHPARLTDETIEALLKGGEAQEKAVASLAEKPAGKVSAVGEIRKAINNGDYATAETKIKALESTSPDTATMNRIILHLAKGEWDTASKLLADVPDTKARNLMAFNLTIAPVYLEKAPPAFLGQVADGYEAMLGEAGSPVHYLTLAKLRWNAGAKDRAIAAAEKAAVAAETEENREQGLAEPLRRMAGSMKAGTLPDAAAFSEWVKEARPKPAK